MSARTAYAMVLAGALVIFFALNLALSMNNAKLKACQTYGRTPVSTLGMYIDCRP